MTLWPCWLSKWREINEKINFMQTNGLWPFLDRVLSKRPLSKDFDVSLGRIVSCGNGFSLIDKHHGLSFCQNIAAFHRQRTALHTPKNTLVWTCLIRCRRECCSITKRLIIIRVLVKSRQNHEKGKFMRSRGTLIPDFLSHYSSHFSLALCSAYHPEINFANTHTHTTKYRWACGKLTSRLQEKPKKTYLSQKEKKREYGTIRKPC